MRQEVDALKRAMLEGRTTIESLALPPPAPLDANGDVIRPISPPTPSATASRKLNKPNVRKDIAPTQGSPAFWAGTHGFGGGVTPVHATLVPDITLPATTAQARNLAASAPLAASASASASAITSELLSGKMSGWWAHSAEQENLNPLMNLPPPLTPAQQQVQEERELARLNSSLLGGMGMSRFDAFMELNPFTIKSAEDYRMQLWAQMAASRQQQQYFAQQGQQGQQPQQRFAQPTYAKAQQSNTTASGSLLSQAPRAPLFFSSPTSPSAANTPSSSPQSPKSTLAALLAGKPVGSSSSSTSKTTAAYPSPPTSPRASHARPITSSNAHNNSTPTQQQAMVAALASQTLLSRMGSAFWEAFSGSSTSSGSTTRVGGPATGTGTGAQRPSWDAEKVRKVLEGRAVLRVVDVEPPAVSVINEKVFVDEGLGLGLEEKMKSLSIGGERQERCAAQMERDRCAEAAAKTIAEGTGVFMNLRK